MPKIPALITRLLISGVALAVATVQIAPLAFAEMSPPDASGNSCFIVGSDQPGNNAPAGSDANLFTYNCATNVWESSHYIFSPITDQRTPKDQRTYTYNSASGKYDSPTWEYSATLNDYVLTKHAVATPPAGAIVIGGPPAPSSSITNTGDGSNNTITNNGTPSGSQSINGTGDNSTNGIANNNTGNTNINNGSTATVTNTINGQAISGNAGVLSNTIGGSATSGNTLDEATIVNMLQSSSNALSGNTVTFVANIDGDVNGDLLLDPASLGSVQAASAPGNTNLTINNSASETINNNVTLNADSGNATVAGNTQAGNATSGSAQAIANVVNLINSAITSGHSFIGTININGNLNGDILIPADFIDQLIADNVPTVTIAMTGNNSTNTITNTGGQTTNVDNNTNQGIDNNVTSSAVSGTAKVSGNTNAGNATTGNTSTNLTAFNLTGSNVIGRNDLLVFVNVVGTWVGMIVNAPAGATAAELGGGISSNTTNGTTDVSNTSNQQINNNINVAAQSGNANVKDNTVAGNATSGNAGTAVNLLNVENSSLAFSNWFGVLFINVFGTWNGSFGMNTAAGNPASKVSNTSAGFGGGFGAAIGPVFSFVPHANGTTSVIKPAFAATNNGGGGTSPYSVAASVTPGTGTVIAAKTIQSKSHSTPVATTTSSHFNWAFIVGTSVAFGGTYLFIERLITLRQTRNKTLI